MKEYRIRAKSPEHRKAIIGALEGLGFPQYRGNEGKEYSRWPGVGINSDGDIALITEGGRYTHESLDLMLDDIIRDRQTVEIEIDNGVRASVSQHSVTLKVRSESIVLTTDLIDRIAAAVAKVRGQ